MTSPIQYPFESVTRFDFGWEFSSDTGLAPYADDRGIHIPTANTNSYLRIGYGDTKYYLTGSNFFVHLSKPINFGESLRFHFIGEDADLDFTINYDTIDIVGFETVTTDANGLWYGVWTDADGTHHIRASLDGITWKEESTLAPGLEIDQASLELTFQLIQPMRIVSFNIIGEPPIGFGYISKINIIPVPVPLPTFATLPAQVQWEWAIGEWRGGVPTHRLNYVSNRQIRVKLNEPDEVTYTLQGDAPEANEIKDLISDLWVMRNGRYLTRTRHIASQDNIGTTDYTIDYTTTSYAGLLSRRIIDTNGKKVDLPSTSVPLYGLSFSAIPPEDTLLGIINHVQSQKGMDLGIRKGYWPDLPISALAWQFFSDGTSALDAIHTVIRPAGIDFWIDQDLKANISAQRGTNNESILDWGGRVESVSRSFDHTAYANYIRQTGATAEAGLRATIPNIDTRPEGGWASQLSAPEIISYLGDLPLAEAKKVVEQLQSVANANFARLSRTLPLEEGGSASNFSYSVKLKPGIWRGPEHIWVGDIVQLVVKRGRLDINHQMRVIELNISVDQNGFESVELTLNWPNNPKDLIKQFVQDVRTLQRR